MKQKHILIVNSGYPFKGFTLSKLKELGYYVIALDSKKICPDELVNETIVANLQDDEECIKAVEEYLKQPGNYIDGSCTFWDEAVLLTAKINQAFGWIGIPYDVAFTAKNKFEFREFCKKEGLPNPKHMSFSSTADIHTVSSTLSYPLVIKPVFGAASAFVIKVHNPIELLEAYKVIQKHIREFWLAPEWKSLEVYVEEYIPGNEVDIDILLQDGKIKFWSISDNFQTHEPYFIETSYAIPSSLSSKKKAELLTMAEKTLDKIGIKNGCIHFEAKYSPTGPYPLEINMRMGGDDVYNDIKLAWGVDLVEYTAKIALGDEIGMLRPEKPLSYIHGSIFLPEKSGILTYVLIDPQLYTKSYVKDFKFTGALGDRILIPPYNYDNLGWLTVVGSSSKQAKQFLEEGLRLITYTITSDEHYQIPVSI